VRRVPLIVKTKQEEQREGVDRQRGPETSVAPQQQRKSKQRDQRNGTGSKQPVLRVEELPGKPLAEWKIERRALRICGCDVIGVQHGDAVVTGREWRTELVKVEQRKKRQRD